jgi:hypothetical protein
LDKQGDFGYNFGIIALKSASRPITHKEFFMNNKTTAAAFKELLNHKKFKEALSFLKMLNEEQQIGCLDQICTNQPATINMDQLKTATILVRKIKEKHTYDDFLEAWLPPTTDTIKHKDPLKRYWGDKFGMPIVGCAIHAKNINDPSEIMTIGLQAANLQELSTAYTQAEETEMSRYNSITKVADVVGKTEIFEIIEIVF